VILCPEPTVFAAHPLIGIERQADDLIDAPLRASLLETVWEVTDCRARLSCWRCSTGWRRRHRFSGKAMHKQKIMIRFRPIGS
jgi:hypothetical protein